MTKERPLTRLVSDVLKYFLVQITLHKECLDTVEQIKLI